MMNEAVIDGLYITVGQNTTDMGTKGKMERHKNWQVLTSILSMKMGKNILCFLLKGRFVFRAFKNGKWQALTLFFKRVLAAPYCSRAGNKISSKW